MRPLTAVFLALILSFASASARAETACAGEVRAGICFLRSPVERHVTVMLGSREYVRGTVRSFSPGVKDYRFEMKRVPHPFFLYLQSALSSDGCEVHEEMMSPAGKKKPAVWVLVQVCPPQPTA